MKRLFVRIHSTVIDSNHNPSMMNLNGTTYTKIPSGWGEGAGGGEAWGVDGRGRGRGARVKELKIPK